MGELNGMGDIMTRMHSYSEMYCCNLDYFLPPCNKNVNLGSHNSPD